jgi:hypothetical protein
MLMPVPAMSSPPPLPRQPLHRTITRRLRRLLKTRRPRHQVVSDGGGLVVAFGVALYDLPRDSRIVRHLAIISIAFAVLSSGVAYGNSFLDSYVGRWATTHDVVFTHRGRIVEQRSFTSVSVTTKLSDGTYASVTFNDAGKKTSETLLQRKGKVNTTYYDDDGLFSHQGRGVWSVRNGILRISETWKTLTIKKGVARGQMRWIDANTYGGTATSTITYFPYADGPRNPTFRVKTTATGVRLAE